MAAKRQAPADRRTRRTVQIDPHTFNLLLDDAASAEAARLRAAAALFIVGRPALGTTPAGLAGIREQLLGHLKAFLDAALPAGGLALDGDGAPHDLPRLVASGRINGFDGESAGKLLLKLRARSAIDLRLAEAVLHFFRIALGRPSMALEDIGAVESSRLLAAQHIAAGLRAARDDLPAQLHDGWRRRTEEVASYPWAFDQMTWEYRDLTPFTDAGGVRRVRLTRVTRYRTIRLVSSERRHRPNLAYEWHEWRRFEEAQLTTWLVDGDRTIDRMQVPLRKRLDAERGWVVFEMDPHTAPAGPDRLADPFDDAGQRLQRAFEWRERMVINMADRDLLVSYMPVNQPRILFDAAANAGFRVQVGDSPGLRRTADGWLLDRTLLPREVLAVRIRSVELNDSDALALSPAGEWRGPAPA